MTAVRPLREVLSEVPDPRARGGRRYEFEAILLLICVAMLCGCKNPNQIATWGASQSREFLEILGFKRGMSIRKSALYEVVSRIDAEDLEKRLMIWVESVVAEMKAAGIEVSSESSEEETSPPDAIALDGKTLRGSKKQGAQLSHLLSAVDHKTAMTLVQVPVDGKTNEIPLTLVLLERLHLEEERVFTTDALLTQTAIAQAIVKKGGPTSCR